MSNQSTITTFLRGKGLTTAQVAGVAGNLQIESGFSPTAYNPGEKAIGIAQWEGSRRTALQAYARKAGTSETDLKTQLGFLWHELTTSESGALAALRATSTPAAAAAAFDKRYERSSGKARSARESAANVIARTLGGGKPVNPSTPKPTSAAAPTTTASTTSASFLPAGINPDPSWLLPGGPGLSWLKDQLGIPDPGASIVDGVSGALGGIGPDWGKIRDFGTTGAFIVLGGALIIVGAAKLAAPAAKSAAQTAAPVAAAAATKGAA